VTRSESWLLPEIGSTLKRAWQANAGRSADARGVDVKLE
jgi:hypothetical protein